MVKDENVDIVNDKTVNFNGNFYNKILRVQSSKYESIRILKLNS